MLLRPVVSAALLAFFAAACQPAEKPAEPGPETVAAPEAAPAPAGTSQLASFKTGKFDRLDFDVDLAAPTASFVDETGKAHSFAEYKGKVLVYNIWAEWCGPCVEEMPSLARLQKAFVGKDVAVVPVAYGFGQGVTRESTLAKFRSLVGTDLPFYFDGEQVLQSEAQTGALPATLIYDKTGKEVARLAVPAPWDSPEAVALIQAVLDGKS
ncbi:MAG: TlpA disulfide reductase family protein [Hyphomonadaceae bacterium]